MTGTILLGELKGLQIHSLLALKQTIMALEVEAIDTKWFRLGRPIFT